MDAKVLFSQSLQDYFPDARITIFLPKGKTTLEYLDKIITNNHTETQQGTNCVIFLGFSPYDLECWRYYIENGLYLTNSKLANA